MAHELKKTPKIIFSFSLKMSIALILFVIIFFASIILGAADTSLYDVWLALTSRQSVDPTVIMIREIRIPREIGAIFIGASLAVAGAIMQGLTRNPLADPGLLGLTAGANAALAATIAFFPTVSYLGTIAACMIGAGVGAFLVFGIGSMRKGGLSPLRMVLAGAAISAFLYAVAEGIAILFRISQDVSMWTAGGLIGITWSQLQFVIPITLIGLIIAMFLAKPLTILSLDEEVAVNLGQSVGFIKLVLIVVVFMLAGTSVALAGNMVFIGLMIPHIVRSIVGTDYRFVLPMSALTGAIFMLLADTLGRTLNAPYETPVAAIVAMMGLPFFLFIVKKGGKGFA